MLDGDVISVRMEGVRGFALSSIGKTSVSLTLQVVLGVLYGLGFASLSWWPVALIALTCHLIALRHLRGLIASSLGGWLFGVGFFIMSLHWIQKSFAFGPAALQGLGWIASLSLILGLFNGLVALLAHPHVFRGWLQPAVLAALCSGGHSAG